MNPDAAFPIPSEMIFLSTTCLVDFKRLNAIDSLYLESFFEISCSDKLNPLNELIKALESRSVPEN